MHRRSLSKALNSLSRIWSISLPWKIVLFTVVINSGNARALSSADSGTTFEEMIRFKAIYGGGSIWGPFFEPRIRGEFTSLWISYHGQEKLGIRVSYTPTYHYSTRPSDYIPARGFLFGDGFDLDYARFYSATLKYLHPINKSEKFYLSLEGGISYIHADIKEYSSREIEEYPSWFGNNRSSNYYKSTRIINTFGIPLQASLEYGGKIINWSVYLRAEANEINSIIMWGASLGLGFSK